MEFKAAANSRKIDSLQCPHGTISLSAPLIMGILNVTTDSFYDGGRYTGEEALLIRAEQLLEEGAAILDIGAVSSRPGAKIIPEKEELSRLLPALKTLRSHFPTCIISVDTFRAAVAREAILAGADIINDIAGGNLDATMFTCVAELRVPYVLMHMQGKPETMQDAPHYEDVCSEVFTYFKEKTASLEEAGVRQIILDPGFGFGKNVAHNYELLKHLSGLLAFGYPLLAGLSRKAMINKVLGTNPESALNGTTVANTIALLQGASVLRVHDVRAAAEAVKIVAMCRE